MRVDWLMVGALGAAVSIGLGAFGAHALEARLDARSLALWETAARYLMYGALGLGLIGVVERQVPGTAGPSGLMLALGTLLFASTVAALALGGPRWLGAVTPIGGALMIAAWLWLAWSLVTRG